ncbi:MAG: 2-amino-4-hydroxy-6-hydroxymethyldihydropteridine diphosphokinase, partial [Xanthomonadales bacterium]|nr:2-amino-4-hydroxy-6-hydroxymethyldihydropteridine diphosphokinase [Xanthomonadales bacterium]
DAATLLDTLLSVEAELGRKRGEKWGPRLIDLDLLSFDEMVLETEHLSLPHPFMHQRAFVLVPLLELDPDFVIAGRGRADECLATLGDSEQVVPI